MKLKLVISYFLLTLMPAPILASSNKIKLNEYIDNKYINLSLHNTSFKVGQESFSSMGLRFSYKNYLSKSFSIQPHLVLSGTTQGASTMFGMGAVFSYDLFSAGQKLNAQITTDETPLIEFTRRPTTQIEFGLGLDQYYLNGLESVYSISGPSAQAIIYFLFFEKYYHVGYKLSSVKVQSTPESVSTFFVGVSF